MLLEQLGGSHEPSNIWPVAKRAGYWAPLLVPLVYIVSIELEQFIAGRDLPQWLLLSPGAVLLTALLLTPRISWPLIIAFTLPAHLLAQIGSSQPITFSVWCFVINVVEALVAAATIRHFLGHRTLPDPERVTDIVVILVSGSLFGPLAASLLDRVILAWSGQGGAMTIWSAHLVAASLATVVIVPAALADLGPRRGWLADIARGGSAVEAIILVVLISLCSALAIADVGLDRSFSLSMMFLLVPLLSWTAARFRPAFIGHLLIVPATILMTAAYHGRGPFGPALDENLGNLELFIACVGASMLLLSSAIIRVRADEHVLQRRTQQLQLALQYGDIEAWTLDTHAVVDGMEGDGMTHKPLPDFFARLHADDAARFQCVLREAIVNANAFSVDVRLSDADKPPAWIMCRGTPRFSSNGQLSSFWCVNVDISERRRDAEQIREQRNELAHLSRVAMLGEMSGAIAHELNQPLTAILSNAQAASRLLKRGEGEAAGDLLSEILDDVVGESKRAGEIIQRMRSLLKKGTVQAEPLDLNELIPCAIQLEHSDIIARNIAVVTHLEPELPLVNGDTVQLQQVILNLIANACDALRECDIRKRLIRITTRRLDDGMVELAVADDGFGIKADQLERIFEPFVSSKQHGLGLGLTICRSIIAAHGGDMSAANEPDGGAVFSLRLPSLQSSE